MHLLSGGNTLKRRQFLLFDRLMLCQWVISARLCGARAYVFSRAAGNLLALCTPAT
jgi:hypothetical protein